jgi:ATP-dependent Zn protease
MKSKLDNDVQEIMQGCLKETEALLIKEDKVLERLTKTLLEKEELNHDEIQAIFNECAK